MFLSIGMLKQKYFLTDIFILSAEKQPIKLSWRKIEWLHIAEWRSSLVSKSLPVKLAAFVSILFSEGKKK